MKRPYGLRSLAIICGLWSTSLPAADVVPDSQLRYLGDRTNLGAAAPTPAVTAPQPGVNNRPAAPSFADRMQSAQQYQLRQEQQKQADENRPKPTNWQMQNASNPQNNSPTSLTPNGTVAPNNYFGTQFHNWSNVSTPAPMTQLPYNQKMVPAINQTNVYTAPNNYYGSQFSSWSNLRSGQLEPNATGGWNYR